LHLNARDSNDNERLKIFMSFSSEFIGLSYTRANNYFTVKRLSKVIAKIK